MIPVTRKHAMIDRRPAAIVQCAQADDVPPVIKFARKNGLELSIRGAGHNIAGNALCDNGVTIDFSKMKSVRVEDRKSTRLNSSHGSISYAVFCLKKKRM